MKCLWLTRKYPRPANSGELLYSEGLIRSLAEAGVEMTVIAHDNEEQPLATARHQDEYGVLWELGSAKLGGRLPSLLSPLPADAWRLRGGGLARLFRKALKRGGWDAVVIDHAAMGWAWPIYRSFYSRRPEPPPRLAYISHNHEAKIRRDIARSASFLSPRGLALRWDAGKYARLEEQLCAAADLVTAITPEEVEAYRLDFPHQHYLCLRPGYSGKRFPDRKISPETPRRVVMSGSFEWIAKQENLERFLAKGASTLAEAGIELQVVGKAPEGFRQDISRRYPAVVFTGTVPEVSPYLREARFGLIVEELGGGFKLKALDYVFHSLPIAGLECSVTGVPLKSPNEILLAENTEDLIERVVARIDRYDLLNEQRAAAYRRCEREFDWSQRGAALRQFLTSPAPVPASARSLAPLPGQPVG